MSAFATSLDFYSAVLEMRGLRQQLLTADIANASTPGFKAVDLDFREALAATLAAGQAAPAESAGLMMLVSDPGHFASSDDDGWPAGARRSVKYQTGGSVALDGNSVDLNFEKMTAAENALDYEAVASFTTQAVNLMMIAIKGSAPSSGASS